MAKEEKSFREMVEEFRNNPDIEKMPDYQEGVKSVEKMDVMAKKIIHTIVEITSDLDCDSDPEWPLQVYLALAKATCYIIAGMEKAAQSEGKVQLGKSLFQRYVEDLLPMSYEIVCGEIAEREEAINNLRALREKMQKKG